jgi:hypothetical protein
MDPTAGEDPDAPGKRPQVELVDVVGQGGVAGAQRLEAAVEQEAVLFVGRDPATDPVGRVEDPNLHPGVDEDPGGRQSGQSRPDNDHVRPLGHKVTLVMA